MDSLTHIVVGASLGQAISHKKFNRKAAGIGALACTAPDFDVFIYSSLHPLWPLIWHRSFSHALIFIPIGALLIAGILLLIFKPLRPDWRQVILVSLVAYASHGILDACTAYGTQLLWPFSHLRVSWDIIAIVDPVFTLLFIIGCSTAYYYRSALPARCGLAVALLYLAFCFNQHQRALNAELELIHSQDLKVRSLRAMPEFASQYHWNGLLLIDNTLHFTSIDTPLFYPSQAQEDFSFPAFDAGALPYLSASAKAAIETFAWFTQDTLIAVSQSPLILVDGRYVKKHPHPIGLWGLEFIPQETGTQLILLHQVPIEP